MRAIVSAILVAPLLAAPAVAPGAAPSPATGLCRAGERIVFTCGLRTKTVSVCAGGAGEGAYVQYRYGLPGRVEFAYPATGTAGLLYANEPYSGGGQTQVSFTRDGVTYAVYSRMVRTRFDGRGNDPQFDAGVVVRRDGKPLVERRCVRPADASLDLTLAQRYLREGEIVDH